MSIEEARIQQEQNKSTREQVVEHVAKLSFASAIGGVGQFINGYFAALLLGPTIFGIWKVLGITMQYGGLLHLGMRFGMHREIPILRGKGDLNKQLDITNATFAFNFAVAVFVASALFISTFFLGMRAEYTLGLRFVAIIIFLQYIHGFYNLLFRANNQFDIASKIHMLDGLGFLLSVVLLYFFSFAGFLGGQVLRLLICTLYSYHKSSFAINWQWNPKIMRTLISIGFPIMLIVFADTLFTTVDRLLILDFFGVEQLGFYSLGFVFFAPIMVFIVSSNSVLYPRFAERFGRTKNIADLKQYIVVPTTSIALFSSIIVTGMAIILPGAISILLPAFADGITAAQILVFGLFFYAVAGMAGNLFITVNKQTLRLGILLFSALVNLILSFIMIKLGYGIEGVAVGTGLSYLLFFLISVSLAMKHCQATRRENLKLIANVLIPFAYCIAIFFLVTNFIGHVDSTRTAVIKSIFLQGLVLIVLTAYPLYRTLRALGIMKLLRKNRNTH